MSTQNTPPTTRKRTSPQSSSPSRSDQIQSTADNLPPSRKTPGMRSVSAPLSSTRLSRLIYILIGLTALLGAYYSYRAVQYKREVGGWWSLAMGRSPADVHAQRDAFTGADSTGGRRQSGGRRGRGGNEVEDHINALAEVLGMPSNELASAIASAVRAHVPPATLSSIAAKQTGEAVKVLVSEQEQGEKQRARESGHPAGVVEGVVHGMESFVGMDEP